MRTSYPSDISREQFEKIHEDLTAAKKKTHPSTYDYDIWTKADENGVSILDRVLRKLVEAEREKNGREKQTTMIIVDSKSIQNADTAEEKGYDAGKKHLE